MIIDLNIIFFLIVYCIIVLILFLRTRKIKTRFERMMIYLFSFYILLLIKITLLPIVFDDMSEFNTSCFQMIPFSSIIDSIKYSTFAIQVIGNIVLFMPLSLFINLLLGERNNSFRKTIIIGIIMTLSIEILQLIENLLSSSLYRKIDIDDVILNMMGVFIGIIICAIIKKIIKTSKESKSMTVLSAKD